MLVAEELEADWSKIRVESAPVDPAYNHSFFPIQMTGGSTSVNSEWERLRTAGATARMMLIAAAAEAWGVDPQSCRAELGYVIHGESNRRLSFGALAAAAARLDPPREVALKDPPAHRLIGTRAHRLDTPSKVNGTAQFGLDVRVPGMLTAVLARPPNAAISTASLREQYAGLAKTPGVVARKEGNPAQALAGAARRITAEYEVPYLAHAMMEPLNCLVDLRSDRCEIWTGTQFQSVDREAAAAVAGLRPEQVYIHTTFLGGGFGRRANPASDFVVEAVEVAKVVQAPVKVVWTREDDIQGGWYRPMWYDRLAAGLDADGMPVAWTHTIVGQSIMAGTGFEGFAVKDGIDSSSVEGAADLPYAIPNVLVDLHSPKVGVPVQWWRSVGHSHTAFVVESFIDELARTAGKDPYEFRRGLLANRPRHLGVLEFAASKAGWGTSMPRGRGRGVAEHFSFNTYVAQVAEVSVQDNGTVRVDRVVCAVDCGRVVNPDIVAAQMEGGIIFGLAAALKGEITLARGRVQQRNFNDYQLLRMNEAPAIEVHIVPSAEPPTGVGEPGVPPIAPAVANAIFAATGRRVRRLPVRASDVRRI
jgi:isoquinoline 1-oxidoreductase beta subunit